MTNRTDNTNRHLVRLADLAADDARRERADQGDRDAARDRREWERAARERAEREGERLVIRTRRAALRCARDHEGGEHEADAIAGAVLADLYAAAAAAAVGGAIPTGTGRPADVLAWIARGEGVPAPPVPVVSDRDLARAVRRYGHAGKAHPGRVAQVGADPRVRPWDPALLTTALDDGAVTLRPAADVAPADVIGEDVLALAGALADATTDRDAGRRRIRLAVAQGVAVDRRLEDGAVLVALAARAEGVTPDAVRKRAAEGVAILRDTYPDRAALAVAVRRAALAAGVRTRPDRTAAPASLPQPMRRPRGSARDVLAWIDQGARILATVAALRRTDPGMIPAPLAAAVSRTLAALRPAPGYLAPDAARVLADLPAGADQDARAHALALARTRPLPPVAGAVGDAVRAATHQGGAAQPDGGPAPVWLRWPDREREPGAVTLYPPSGRPTPGSVTRWIGVVMDLADQGASLVDGRIYPWAAALGDEDA